MRLAKTLTPSSPISWNQAFAPKLCHWLFPSSSSSSHFDRFPIFPKSHNVHDLCCETRGRQLSNGLSSAMRTSVFCSAEIRRVLPLSFHVSQSHLFPHDRWPCDHPPVVPLESLQLPHTLELVNLEVISCFGSFAHIKNDFCENQDL